MLSFDFEKLRMAYKKGSIPALSRLSDQLLAEALNSGYLIDKLYYHPLSFFYAIVHVYPNKETIRLHIWNKDVYDITPELKIHNHYYRVNSFVYVGTVINQLYEVSNDSPIKMALYKGSYSSEGDRHLTRTDEKISIAPIKTELHQARSLYIIEPSHIHYGDVVGTQITCTLVYTEAPDRKEPLVFGADDLTNQLVFTKSAVTNDITNIVLNSLRAQIQ